MLKLAISVALALPILAQDQNSGWRRVGDAAPAEQQPQFSQDSAAPEQAPPPSTGWHRFGESAAADPQPRSSGLTLPAGAWITIRVDQPLSSDHNQPGDAFTGTLVQPLVANGRIVSRRGQTIGGRVVSAEKAGRAKGVSHLGLELTEIGLADGTQVPVKTQLIERRGNTSVGRDAAAIGATTATGAAIGAAVNGGVGAGVGAGAGLIVSTLGVLLTRGRPTVVYPEHVLTFRLEAPLTIATERAEDAFQPVTQEDYDRATLNRRAPPVRMAPGPPPPYYYGYGYPYGYYAPYYWGPSFGFYVGPRFYGRGFGRRW